MCHDDSIYETVTMLYTYYNNEHRNLENNLNQKSIMTYDMTIFVISGFGFLN